MFNNSNTVCNTVIFRSMPTIPIYALSSKGENLSTLGSTFTYRFKTPLQIPNDVECTLSLNQASLWYVQPNISIALNNNKMKFSYAHLSFGLDNTGDGVYVPPGDSGSSGDYNNGTGDDGFVESPDEPSSSTDGGFTLTFDDGIYSLTALQAALRLKLMAIGAGLDGNEITLMADNAQQKLVFIVNPTVKTGDIKLCFGDADFTMRDFLGFASNPTTTIQYTGDDGGNASIIGVDTAMFNAELSYFIMNCSLSSGAYDSDGNFNSTQIAQMFPINIEPGSQLVHVPYNPIRCSTTTSGQTISTCTFSVTNQHGTLQDMRGEEFSALVILEY